MEPFQFPTKIGTLSERMVWRRDLLGSAYRRSSAASAGLRESRERLQDSSFRLRSHFRTRRGYVPPNGQGWVDHIWTKGNEANHEIRLMRKTDAEELISFSEMLLKFIYEFPQRVMKAGEA